MTLTLVKSRDLRMQELIDNCSDCHSVCLETLMYCMEQGDAHTEPAHIRALVSCAEMCAATLSIATMGFGGRYKVAEACAELCDACAESCERYRTDRPIYDCAEVCRWCAESARKVLPS